MREIKFQIFDKEANEMLCEHRSMHGLSHYLNNSNYGVRQYTGLKDKNDKEIFEGDIVRISGHPFQGPYEMDCNYEVGYNEYMELCCGSWYLFRMRNWAEVIGNIYENPELLEESK